VWEERICIFYSSRKVETKKAFHFKMRAFKDIRESYINTLTTSSWDNLFSKGFVKKQGEFIVRLQRKMAKYKEQMEKQSVP